MRFGKPTTEKFTIKKTCDSMIICSIESESLCNGSQICKEISFHCDGKWELTVCGTSVNLHTIHANDTFSLDRESIISVCTAVEKLQLSEGVKVTKSVIVSRFHTLDQFQKSTSAKPVRTLRSLTCDRNVTFGTKSLTCKTCRKMEFNQPS